MSRLRHMTKYLFLSILGMGVLLMLVAYEELDFDMKSAYTEFDESAYLNQSSDIILVKDGADYQDVDQEDLNFIYVTALGISPEDFMDWVQNNGVGNKKLEIYFTDKHESLLERKITDIEANAEIYIKQSSYDKNQKSFKVRLYDKYGLWKEQKTLSFDKNFSDPLRVREKLSFDLIAKISNLPSLRTTFARVFGQATTGRKIDGYEDFGFYTQVEEVNKLYLKNHDLDPNGPMYEVKDFDFYLNGQDINSHINSRGDVVFNNSFIKRLENKNDDAMSTLLETIDNDYYDTDLLLSTYFDEENYFTWLAVNIIFDSYDCSVDNYMLYSPINSSKWYFIPNDFDKSWGNDNNRLSWQHGINMFLNNKLHYRILSNPQNVEKLTAKIDEISSILTPEVINNQLTKYYEVLFANVTKLPDIKYLRIPYNDFKTEYTNLSTHAKDSILEYTESLKYPSTFKMLDYTVYGGQIEFSWTPALSFENESIHYTLEISTDVDFLDVVYQSGQIKDEKVQIPSLAKGTYFWRVTASDEDSDSQRALNVYKNPFGIGYDGVAKMTIR